MGLIALLVVLATTVRWFWRAFRVAIPKTTPYLFAVGWASGAMLGIFALIQHGGGVAAGWAAGLGLLFFYFVTTGAQKVGERMVVVGDQLPAFRATDDRGELFDSAELVGKPLLLKFFRGHW